MGEKLTSSEFIIMWLNDDNRYISDESMGYKLYHVSHILVVVIVELPGEH